MSDSKASPQREFSISRVLHIFQNDVRRLWPQSVATFALMVLVIWSAPYHWLPWDQRPEFAKMVPLAFLLPMAWYFLIVRAIHTDKLVGDHQFWVTRPYGWKNLLAAKVLFIILAVNLPMLISDAVVLARAGFIPTGYALGLIWRQLLLTIVLVLPAITLATLTGSPTQAVERFILPGIFLSIPLIFLASGLYALGLYALNWIRTCVELLLVFLTCIAVLLWQYSRRERTISFQVLAAGLVLMVVVRIFMPWSTLISQQYSHSEASPRFNPVQLDYNPDPALYTHVKSSPGVPGVVGFQLPVRVSGLPEGYVLSGDAVKVSVEAADGLSWHSRWENSGMIAASPSDSNPSFVDFTVDDWLFERVKSEPVKLRLRLALTLLKEHSVTVVATKQPFRVPGVGICEVTGNARNGSDTIFCRAPLRTPYQFSVNIDWTGSRCFTVTGEIEADRYQRPPARDWFSNMDPFPAEFSILPVTTFGLGGITSNFANRNGNVSYYICPGVQLTVGTHQATAHIQTELETSGIRLTDYQIETSQ